MFTIASRSCFSQRQDFQILLVYVFVLYIESNSVLIGVSKFINMEDTLICFVC